MLPFPVDCFRFAGREFDPETGVLRLGYRIEGQGASLRLVEYFDFGPGKGRTSAAGQAMEAALDLLHWIAGTSYWKAACRGRVVFDGGRVPDPAQADVLETVYRAGLAELAWRNGLDGRYWPDFISAAGEPAVTAAEPAGLANGTLVPMGGGKDSLVALERVRRCGSDPDTVQVGSAGLIGSVACAARARHHVIARRLAPELHELNAAGAINGHVPITAINAAALVVMAIHRGFGSIVFANERSADLPTLVTPDGAQVNHQFAKSFEFEQLFGDWVHRCIAPDLDVFSLLRRERELAVCREFAELTRYHDVFSSCNRNFHLDGPRAARWCGTCPKCTFVFLSLAPFLDVESMVGIFGNDLLDDPERCEDFGALLALEGPRPFECVGEPDEARCAVRLLADDRRWRDHVVVRELSSRIAGVDVPDASSLLEPGGPHRIPQRFMECALPT